MYIEPSLAPPLDGVGEFDVEVLAVRTNTDNNAADVIGDAVGAITADAENALPQSPIRLDSEEALTQCDKNRHVEDGIGRQLMQLKPIDKEEAPKKFVDRGRKTADEMVNKTDPILHWRRWIALFLGEARCVLLLGEPQLLLQIHILAGDLGSLLLQIFGGHGRFRSAVPRQTRARWHQ